jgi:ketosteroid isomerase-like protein
MSEENVAIVERARRFYAAYNRRDWDGVFADTDPEFEFDPTEEGGVYRGRRAITELAENWFSTWKEWGWEPEEIELASKGERMFVSLRSRGRSKGSDAIIEGRFFHVIDMRDGTFLRCREYVDRGKAVASFEAPSSALDDERRWRSAFDQSRSDVLTGTIGARRAWTVSMISALSMPCR